MTPDLGYSVKVRREILEEWRSRPEYRAASDAFLKKNQWCEIWLEVGVKVRASEIHHPFLWSYDSFELYVNFEHNGAMAVSGSRNGGGHYAIHHDLKVCPICKKKKCQVKAEACKVCLRKKYIEQPEPVKHQLWTAQRTRKRAKRRFPCGWRVKNQRCVSPLNSSPVCDRSVKTCTGCDYFIEKVPA